MGLGRCLQSLPSPLLQSIEQSNAGGKHSTPKFQASAHECLHFFQLSSCGNLVCSSVHGRVPFWASRASPLKFEASCEDSASFGIAVSDQFGPASRLPRSATASETNVHMLRPPRHTRASLSLNVVHSGTTCCGTLARMKC